MFTIQQLMRRNELVQRLAMHPRFATVLKKGLSRVARGPPGDHHDQ